MRTGHHPVALLQQLIRFDTTNPPGHTAECIGFIDALLTEAGIETQIVAQSPEHPNLIARLPGKGDAPPLLLYGHLDVVTTDHQTWSHPPFEGVLADGYVWGRGALDMKGGVAMMLSAFLRAKTEGTELPGDVIFAALSDEESGGDRGAKFLVEHHPDLFAGVRYAIGEFGGFTLQVGSQRFYLVQVAEKQVCWLKATFRGAGGHGSMPVRGGAMARMAACIHALDQQRLPMHLTSTAQQMIETMAASLEGEEGALLKRLCDPDVSDKTLESLGERGRFFDPALHNTVAPTLVRGGEAINVIPSEVTLELDGRLLPGYQPDDLIAELRSLIGDDAQLSVTRFDAGASEPDMGLWDTLTEILHQADPEATTVPFLLSGVTDGRFFSRLGIQTYGFLPMPLPKDFNFAQTIHAADERIPIDALGFGTDAIFTLLQRFHHGDSSEQ